MAGFASLTLAEWKSTAKKMKHLQYTECRIWLTKTHEIDSLEERKAEWALIRSVVNQDTLRDAINKSYFEFTKKKIPKRVQVIKGIKNFDKEAKKLDDIVEMSKPLLREYIAPGGTSDAYSFDFILTFQDIIDWTKTWECLDRYSSDEVFLASEVRQWSWLTFGIHADWPSQRLDDMSEIAITNGWSWNDAGKEDIEWMFYLNAMSEQYYYRMLNMPGDPKSREDWLLKKLRDHAPGVLLKGFVSKSLDTSILESFGIGDDKLPQPTHWTALSFCSVYGLMGADPLGTGFQFWAEHLHMFQESDRDWVLEMLRLQDKKMDPSAPISLTALNGLIAALESDKIKRRLGTSLPIGAASLSAL